MKTFVSAASLLLMWAGAAQAHFIWLVPATGADDSRTIQVYFAEEAAPDDPEYLSRAKGLSMWRVQGRKPAEPLAPVLTEDELSAPVSADDTASLYIATHDLGVIKRGDSEFRLKYYAKTGPSITHPSWQRVKCGDQLRLDVVPTQDQDKVSVKVLFDGEPCAGSQVMVSGPGLDEIELATSDKGVATFDFAKAGLYSIRARHIETAASQKEQPARTDVRHYCTVAVDIPVPLPVVAATTIATVPEMVTSFGAAISNGNLYMYGGHMGGAHSYARDEQSRTLRKLNLTTKEWSELVDGPPLQGLAVVAHGGNVYRLGGFTAMNEEGEDHNLQSQSSVALYVPGAKSWTDLPSLPEPRSSFDAAVLDDTIYVVGGWALDGESESKWHDTAWMMNLKGEPLAWEPVPAPPFERRALALAAFNGKLYAIGGMNSDAEATREVDVFDPATGKWSQGPDIIGDDGLTGFGASAFATGGALYVTTIKGQLQRLNQDGQGWTVVGQTPTARFFHRMLPLAENQLLMVGGASMQTGKFEAVEVLTVP
ncbi:MAG: DUF4198 domain-containing protein [Planctomycetaceae bacterium]|nr:DUF4198 domain-containing protein [Planctomycetaceae bacterium]